MQDYGLTDEFDLIERHPGTTSIICRIGDDLYENGTKYTYLGVRLAPGYRCNGLITVKREHTGSLQDISPERFNMRLVRNHRERYNPAGTHDLGNTGIPSPGTGTVDNTDISSRRVRAAVTVTYPDDPHTSRTTGTFWSSETFGAFVFSHAKSGANRDIKFTMDRS